MKKFKIKKKTWKTICAIALATVVVVGATAGIANLANTNEDGYEKVAVKYEIGGLTSNGKYEESEKTLYTKAGFNVEDKTVFVDIDFDATVQYQLFYYNENDEFLSATEVMTVDYTAEAPEGAVTCRVEITPVWSEDTEKDNQKVTWLNKGGFTDQLKLNVKDVEVEEE